MSEPALLPIEELADARVGGNQPVSLDDPGVVWVVVRGAADVFAVLPEDGSAGGRRVSLFRLERGGALFGLEIGSGTEAIGLVAVASAEAELARVPLASLRGRLDDRGREVAARAIDLWVSQLVRGAEAPPAPGKAASLGFGAALDVAPGDVVRGGEDLVWAELESGSVDLLGSVPITGPAAMALARVTWVRAQTNARLTGRSTLDKLRDGTLWDALQAVHRAALGRVREQAARGRRDEAERIHFAALEEETLLGEAFQRLDDVLDVRRARRFVARGRDAEMPLLGAFFLVARAVGIEVRPPREPRALLDQPDPVGALARATGISIRRVALADDWWRRDGGAMLGFLAAEGRPVALLPASARRYVLVDPGREGPQPVDAAVAATVDRHAYVLFRSFPKHKIGAIELLRFGMKGNGLDLVNALCAAILGGVLALLTPIVTGWFFDVVIPDAERDQLAQYTALLVAAAFASAAFGFCESVSLLRLRGKIDATVQSSVWDRLLRLPMSFFRQYNAGDLANRAMGINAISSTLAIATLHSIFSGMFSVMSLILMFFYDWKLAIIGAILVFLAACVSLALYQAQLGYQRPLHTLVGLISGQVLQLVNGIAKLRVAGAERRAFAAWGELYAEQKRLNLKAQSRANAVSVFTSAFTDYSTLIILIGIAIFSSTIEVGDFAAFNSAFGQFSAGVIGLLGALNSSMAAIPLFERARPILEAVPEVDTDAAEPGELTGRIELDEVSFRYERTGERVLNRVSLTIEPGEFVAIVGPSGAGKSTLFRILLGFEAPESGTVSYDRRNIAGVDLRALRRQLGVVLQDSKLMPGSIFQNIVGSAPLSEDEAWEAARVAGLEDFIRSLPMGMHTFVSEGAVTFSGGQRQRLMIARAIVKKPRVLLFDEATSALDNQTQAVVSDAIAALKATRVVIAHRLSTIMHADRIVVLENGRFVQSGRYDELIAQPGPFADLARRQLA